MQKAKIFNIVLCAGWVYLCAPAYAQNQPVLGQLIEQAKKQKQLELNAASLSATSEVIFDNKKIKSLKENLPEELPPPVLWSLTGINSKLSAEILIDEKIQKINVIRGVALAGGWVVMAGDTASLTLKQNNKVITLFPAPMGTTGGEFQSLKKVKSTVPNSMGELQESLNNRGIPVEFMGPNVASEAVPRSVESARQAASALPVKP